MISFFEKTVIANDISFILLKINRVNSKKLTLQLPLKFRQCYISDNALGMRLQDDELTQEDILDAYLPDKGSVMAGEFGEILSYHLVKSMYMPIRLSGPMKWRFKPDAKRPVQYTDIVLFHLADTNKYSNDDLLVAVESKMKSTNSDKHPIQDAIDGAVEDRTRRLAVTLAWLRRRAIRADNKELRKSYDRFIKFSTYGSYKREFKAIALIDESLVDVELNKSKDTTQCLENTEILAVSIPDLQMVYEKVYADIITTESPTIS